MESLAGIDLWVTLAGIRAAVSAHKKNLTDFSHTAKNRRDLMPRDDIRFDERNDIT